MPSAEQRAVRTGIIHGEGDSEKASEGIASPPEAVLTAIRAPEEGKPIWKLPDGRKVDLEALVELVLWLSGPMFNTLRGNLGETAKPLRERLRSGWER